MTSNHSGRRGAVSRGAGVALALALGACSGAGSGNGDPPIGVSYQVTYKAGTVVLKSADVENGLQSVSSDATTFTLALATPAAAADARVGR